MANLVQYGFAAGVGAALGGIVGQMPARIVADRVAYNEASRMFASLPVTETVTMKDGQKFTLLFDSKNLIYSQAGEEGMPPGSAALAVMEGNIFQPGSFHPRGIDIATLSDTKTLARRTMAEIELDWRNGNLAIQAIGMRQAAHAQYELPITYAAWGAGGLLGIAGLAFATRRRVAPGSAEETRASRVIDAAGGALLGGVVDLAIFYGPAVLPPGTNLAVIYALIPLAGAVAGYARYAPISLRESVTALLPARQNAR